MDVLSNAGQLNYHDHADGIGMKNQSVDMAEKSIDSWDLVGYLFF